MRISDWSSDVCSSDLRMMFPNCSGVVKRLWVRIAAFNSVSPEIGRSPICPPGLWLFCSCTAANARSEEHTSELQSLMRISYAVLCLQKKTITHTVIQNRSTQHTSALQP